MAYPVEPKTSAAGVSAAVAGAALYLLSTYVFKGDVPDGIASLIYVTVPGVVAFGAAWLAPHQHRDPAPALTVPASPPAVSLSGEQMETVRGALASGAERKVPPAP